MRSGRWWGLDAIRGNAPLEFPMSARRTSDDDCGSLLTYPTPSAILYGYNRGAMGRVGPARESLESMARSGNWPTPQARDWKDPRASEATHNNKKHPRPLNEMAYRTSLWPTPTASDDIRGSTGWYYDGKRGKQLQNEVRKAEEAKLWPTPTNMDSRASGAAGYSTESGRHTGTTLTDAARQTVGAGRIWSTPQARDQHSAAKTKRGANSPGGIPLAHQAVGGASTQPIYLSPRWVEWLMAWPIGASSTRRMSRARFHEWFRLVSGLKKS
jgi:hypothetical protein